MKKNIYLSDDVLLLFIIRLAFCTHTHKHTVRLSMPFVLCAVISNPLDPVVFFFYCFGRDGRRPEVPHSFLGCLCRLGSGIKTRQTDFVFFFPLATLSHGNGGRLFYHEISFQLRLLFSFFSFFFVLFSIEPPAAGYLNGRISPPFKGLPFCSFSFFLYSIFASEHIPFCMGHKYVDGGSN